MFRFRFRCFFSPFLVVITERRNSVSANIVQVSIGQVSKGQLWGKPKETTLTLSHGAYKKNKNCFLFSFSDTGGIIHLHNIDTGPYRIVAKVWIPQTFKSFQSKLCSYDVVMSEYKQSIMLLFRASLIKGFVGSVSKVKLRFQLILRHRNSD